MKTIALIGGGCTWVDDCDLETLTQFRWKLRVDRDGRLLYAVAFTHEKTIYMHRLLTSAPRGMLVDHRDGNGLNNLRLNLRVVTHSQNQQNITSSKNQKQGGFKGVHWYTRLRKWRAQIRIPNPAGGKGIRVVLGDFSDPAEAAKAYDAAARCHFGEFASLNFRGVSPL